MRIRSGHDQEALLAEAFARAADSLIDEFDVVELLMSSPGIASTT